VWLSFLIILHSTAATTAPATQPTPAFPTNSFNWQLTDALFELRDPRSTPLERQVARARLEKLGPRAIPAVRRVANDGPSPEVRALAQSALAYLYGFTLDVDGDDTNNTPARTPALSLFDQIRTSGEAVQRLQYLLSFAKDDLLNEALKRNIELLDHGAPGDRLDAADRLSHIRPFASAALPALIRTLNDSNSLVRDAAFNAIAEDAASAPIDTFLTLLNDRDPALSHGAIRALHRFAPDDPRFLQFMHPAPSRESLLAQLRSQLPEQRVQSAAYLAGQKLIPHPVAAALLKAARTGDFVAREGLVLGIERAWADGREVDAALKTIQDDDPNPTNRAYAGAARRAIASIDPN
jgi:hypothetical protein